MSIIYVIVKVLTLPGAIVHTFFEHMSCRMSRVLVDDARAVQFNEMLGHIDHELIKRKGPSFDICFIPFFLNFALGNLILMYGSVSILYFGRFADIFGWICLYLGIALLTNLFPQIEDVMMMNENFYVNNKKKFSKIIVAPFYGIFWLFSRLEKFGLTLITSVAYAVALPYILGLFVPTIYNWLK
jgi:hypothetical protein